MPSAPLKPYPDPHKINADLHSHTAASDGTLSPLDLVERAAKNGVQHLAITDHDTVGLPLRWGESWPTSVMAIQSPALAEVLTWVYERVWAEAVPVVDDEHPWQSLLELMRRGMTMEGAAHALGLSPRTARRRVAAAMDHFDVSSLFALGVAWGNRPTAA